MGAASAETEHLPKRCLFHDRFVQILNQRIYVDPMGLSTLADALETCHCAPNTHQAMTQKDVDGVGIFSDHVTNWHIWRDDDLFLY